MFLVLDPKSIRFLFSIIFGSISRSYPPGSFLDDLYHLCPSYYPNHLKLFNLSPFPVTKALKSLINWFFFLYHSCRFYQNYQKCSERYCCSTLVTNAFQSFNSLLKISYKRISKLKFEIS